MHCSLVKEKYSIILKKLFLLIFIVLCNLSYGQDTPRQQKILFVLDASGSMEAMWGNDTKMNIAKQILYKLVDSLEKTNPNIQVGLRVFGHQYHKRLDNCRDSKLEIPFSSLNQEIFASTLAAIQPNGNTPIAYSLIESAKDFSTIESLNSIILITDGLENCEGDPCDAAKYLNEKRISINPFIIGLAIEDSLVSSFDCIGSFVNAKDEASFAIVLDNTIKQATGKTTLSIHLQSKAKQTISNTPITIQDSYSQETLYTYLHCLGKKGLPDTLSIDPRGWYTVKVHTYPSISSQSFQLNPGKHNDISITIPKSYLAIEHRKQYDEKQAHYLVKYQDEWIYNYRLDDLPLLEGAYQLNVCFTPHKSENILLSSDKVYQQNYPSNGKLSIKNNQALRGSVFYRDTGPWQLCVDLGLFNEDTELKLQPGNYSLIYIQDDKYNSEETHRYDFEMIPERTTVIQLR